MTLNEYKAQLALGTIDFREAAHSTENSEVLQDIVGRTDDIAALSAVSTNNHANLYTLTLLATFPHAEKGVIISCAHHPNVTLPILLQWLKYPDIRHVTAVQWRVRTLQIATGISEDDAYQITGSPADDYSTRIWDEMQREYAKRHTGSSPLKKWKVPDTQRQYTFWTSTGGNSTIELDDKRFKFSIPSPDDGPRIYGAEGIITSYDYAASTIPDPSEEVADEVS